MQIKSQGFTLIELMMALLLLVILSLFAYPTIKEQLAKNEANRTYRILNMSFKQGKTVSYANKKTVSFCLVNKSGNCTNQQGKAVILFYDINHSKNYEKAVDTLLQRHDLNLTYGHVELKAGNRHLIQFWQNTGANRGYFGHIKYCSTVNDVYSFQLSFSQTGRITYKSNTEYTTGC